LKEEELPQPFLTVQNMAAAVPAGTFQQVTGFIEIWRNHPTRLEWDPTFGLVVCTPDSAINVIEYELTLLFTSDTIPAAGDQVEAYISGGDPSGGNPVFDAGVAVFHHLPDWGPGQNFGLGSSYWSVVRLAGSLQVGAPGPLNFQAWIRSTVAGHLDQPVLGALFQFSGADLVVKDLGGRM
jgi:hypothetical protein